MKPLIFIVGPTASGKSALAMALAMEFKSAILNCDSLQFYQRLDIGTAKPTRAERESVPHFLFDNIPAGNVLTAGDFRRAALEVLQNELPKRMVFGVGGSGFYIQALDKGMFDVPKASAEVEAIVREEFAGMSGPEMHLRLSMLDPEYAETINPQDSYRILRAMIILRECGEKVSVLKARFKAEKLPFPVLKLGLAPTREELLPRVERRTREMLDQGLLAEVEQLVADGFAEWPPLQSVGYKECLQHLAGELSRADLERRISEKTMQLTKKQRTWFKRDPEIQWLSGDPLVTARDMVRRFVDSCC